MVVLGLIAFALNWCLAWSLVRENPGPLPLMIMTAATTGMTFAVGIVIALGMVQIGYPPADAVQSSMDVAFYFGLPAAAWSAFCARHQDRSDRTARFGR